MVAIQVSMIVITAQETLWFGDRVKKHKLVGCEVIEVKYNDEFEDIIYKIVFRKGSKKYIMSIEGYDAETPIEEKPL